MLSSPPVPAKEGEEPETKEDVPASKEDAPAAASDVMETSTEAAGPAEAEPEAEPKKSEAVVGEEEPVVVVEGEGAADVAGEEGHRWRTVVPNACVAC